MMSMLDATVIDALKDLAYKAPIIAGLDQSEPKARLKWRS